LIEFQEFKKFDFVVGEVVEIKGNNAIVNVGGKNLTCRNGKISLNKGEKIIVMQGKETSGMLLAAVEGKNISVITIDKEMKPGTRVE